MMPEQNRTTDTIEAGHGNANHSPVLTKDRNGMISFLPRWMRLNFRRVMFTAIPNGYPLSRFAAHWIDNQPLIGGGLMVWVYENDRIEARIIN